MNPRDIPEVVAELIYEMHEVRSELKAINGRVDRLEQTMGQVVQEQRGTRDDLRAMREDLRGMGEDLRGMGEDSRGMREDLQALPNQISAAMFKTLEPFLTKILDNNDQLKNHETRLGRLENPSA